MGETYTITPGTRREIGHRGTGLALVDVLAIGPLNPSIAASLVARELSVRYRGSLLGLLWMVGAPLAMMATYGFVFAGLLGVRGPNAGLHGTLVGIWACMAAWQGFAEATLRSCTVMYDNATLVKRSPAPLALLPFAAAATPLAGLALSWVLVAAASWFVAEPPHAGWLLLPVVVLPLFLMSLGTSYFLSVVGAFVRDVKHAVPLAINAAMLLSPILYPVSAVNGQLATLMAWNPTTPVFEAIRAVTSGQPVGNWGALAAVGLGAWAFAALGYRLFTRKSPEFSDVL